MLEADDVDGFNAKRTERTRIELFAADLSGRKLAGVDLSNANLEKSDLSGTDLTDANLLRANLAGIDGSGIILKEALGLRARFKDAWMDGADLTGADLAQSDFADANLERSTGPGVKLAQARLKGLNASHASWPNADLSEARGPKAKFVQIDLRNANLTEAVFGEADFTGAVLDGVAGAGLKVPGAILVGARLSAARLTGANFSGADLTGADLAAADLSRANLSGANLTNAILRGTVLADANLEGAKLDGADLSEADLTGLDPTALGLDAGVAANLSGFGITGDDAAELVLADLSVARCGDRVAFVWDNPEGEPPPAPPAEPGAEAPPPVEPRVVRFVVCGAGSAVVGVIPVPGDMVLDRQVVAWGEGFRVVVTRARPEGAALVTFTLSKAGELGAARSASLGYDPAVRPVLRVEDGKLRMYGLARRGPTLVIHDLTEAEPKVVRSDAASTARGFLPGHPVLASKGGVVVAVSPTGLQPPRRTPEGFPGTHATALVVGADILAVWAVKRAGTTPGGLRLSKIGRRHAPKEELLGRNAVVVALGALARSDEEADVYWVDTGRDGHASAQLWHARVPEGEPEPMPAPDEVAELQVAPGVLGMVDGGGRFVALDPESAATIATFDPEAR